VTPAGRRRIETERLSLVATDPSHAPDLNRAMLASLEELKPWMSWAGDPSLSHTEAFALDAAEKWVRHEGWTFTIELDNEPVGTIGLAQYQPLLEQAMLGYWIRTDLAGRGLIKEAGRAVVDFGFDEVRLHRMELHASPDNVASIKVAEALGFKREGLARDSARSAYGFYDCLTFGLLATDPRG
jgi:RimJ/RimL family protein N-acetyltransferase